MAFRAGDHKVLDWTRYDKSGTLIKVVRTFNSENLVATEYKSSAVSKAGDPSLYIEYVYDARGNILAENKEVREWTATQETSYNSASETVIDSAADEVAALTKTQYTTDTANVQYWLGLETDGQLTKQHIGTATSTKQIFHYALPTTAVDGQCLQRVHHIDSSVVTGKVDILGVWTQVMQDVASPPISDLTLSAASTVEDQAADVLIGNLATAGDVTGHGTVTWTIEDAGGLANIRLDGTKLEVGPGAIDGDASGDSPYTVNIKAIDELGAYRAEDFAITVTTNDLTDITLSAAAIDYGDAADTAIGTLSYTGGVGTVTPTITNAGGMTNLRLDGNVLEAGPSWMNTAAGTYSVTILATDSLTPTPQTFSKSFTITVGSTAITDIALSANEIVDNGSENDLIGNLSVTGGVGASTFEITDDGGLDNIRIDGVKLEVGSGGIVDAAASFSVTIRATDTRSQTYSEALTVVVIPGFTNLYCMKKTDTAANYFYHTWDQPDADLDGGTGNIFLDDVIVQKCRPTQNYSVIIWFRVLEILADDQVYSICGGAAQYGNGYAVLLSLGRASGSYGPNKSDPWDETIKVGTYIGNAVFYYDLPVGVDLEDGEWHQFIVTWDPNTNGTAMVMGNSTEVDPNTAAGSGDNGYPYPSAGKNPNIEVYIDSVRCSWHANQDYNVPTIRGLGKWNTTQEGPQGIWYQRQVAGNGPTDATTPHAYGFNIGWGMQSGSTNNDYLLNEIDEISFHSVTLTQAQVTEAYNSGIPVNLADATWTSSGWATSDCFVWWRMGDGENDTTTSIVSEAGVQALLDWDDTAGDEKYEASDPARTDTPTLKIKSYVDEQVLLSTFDKIRINPSDFVNEKHLKLPTDDGGFSYINSSYLGPWGGMGSGDGGTTPCGMPDMLGAFSVNWWFRFPADFVTGDNSYIVHHEPTSSQGKHWLKVHLATSTSNRVKLNFTVRSDAEGTSVFKTGNITVSPGWHMYTVIKNTTTAAAMAAEDIDFYYDGVQQTTATVPGGSWVDLEGHTSSTDTDIPRLIMGDTNNVNDKVDEASFFNIALSSGTVATMYNNGIPTNLTGATGLVGWYRFGDGDNGAGADDAHNLIHDMSGSNTTHFDTIGSDYTGSEDGEIIDH